MAALLPWHHMSGPDALRALGSARNGLSESEVKTRLEKDGKNVFIVRKPTSFVFLFFKQFVSPLLLVLALAVFISVFLGHWSDVFLILAIILLNVFLGFFQEYKADRALFALENMLPAMARVRREGVVKEILAENVVVGDVLVLRAGDKIIADGRVLSASLFATNESALTGESREVEKREGSVKEEALLVDQSSMVFAGTTVLQGKGEVLVVATGRRTAFGKVAELVEMTREEDTPLQKELRVFAKTLTFIMISVSLFVLILGSFKGIPFFTMLTVAAALAVAAVPEGLLVSLTVILAAGMRRMLKRGALVKRMVAAETLGSVSVMCVDKTGTLTTGEMTVTELRQGVRLLSLKDFTHEGAELRLALTFLIDEDGVRLSSTEQAVMRFMAHHAISEEERSNYAFLGEIPFSSTKKFSARVWRKEDAEMLFAWGAPEVLLPKCDVDDVKLTAYHKILNDMTGRGLRVLLVGRRTLHHGEKISETIVKDLTPIGFVGLEDPLRPHAQETVETARKAGVRTVMVTGDHPVTAQHVARALGLPGERMNLLTGPELAELSDEELRKRAPVISIFARVLPEQKVRILEAYRSLGHVVAMTGDGVNDAPALRAADIGVAVGSGTDVAKETADMVILDNDVASIVAAIKEGRVVFENIRKVIIYLLTFSLGEVAVISFAILLGFPLPLTPFHILWINLVTDGLPAMALAFEPSERHIMKELTRGRNEPILSAPLKMFMGFLGAITVVSLLGLQTILHDAQSSLVFTRTILFLSLGLDSLIAVFVLRSLRQSVFKVRHFKNPFLLFSLGMSVALLILPVSLPKLRNIFGFEQLSFEVMMALFALTLIKFFIFDGVKSLLLFRRRRYKEKLVS